MKNVYKKQPRTRRAMTLVELMTVSAIMVTVMYVSIPMITPMAQGRIARETARGVETSLNMARDRAIRLGRPCAVALMPIHSQYPYGCIEIEQMTAPPSYYRDSLPDLNKYDTYQVNGVGVRYKANNRDYDALRNSDNNRYELDYSPEDKNVDWDHFGNYLIHPFPVYEKDNRFAKALGLNTGFTLPKGYIVDLCFSQDENIIFAKANFTKKKPPIILFYPDGSAELFNGKDTSTEKILLNDKIFLLVGEWKYMVNEYNDSNNTCSTIDDNGYSNPRVYDKNGNPMPNYDTFWVVLDKRNGSTKIVRNEWKELNDDFAKDENEAINNIRNGQKVKGGN